MTPSRADTDEAFAAVLRLTRRGKIRWQHDDEEGTYDGTFLSHRLYYNDALRRLAVNGALVPTLTDGDHLLRMALEDYFIKRPSTAPTLTDFLSDADAL